MRLRDAEVVIVGMGLMGGSLGLALQGKCKSRIGVARTRETAEQAVRMGAVDHASTQINEAVSTADLIVMSTPVRHIVEAIEQIRPILKPGAVLTDMGSTKGEVVQAMNRLPKHVGAVGGHPMCGKELGGLGAAEAAIYRGAVFVLTPTGRFTPEAMELVGELVEAVGAVPLVLDADRHDKAAASVSHVPYLAAAALVRAEARAEEADPMTGSLAASGFRDTTRVAASPRDMILDTLLTNKAAVEHALDLFEDQLREARALLADPEGLSRWIEQAGQKRREMFL